MSNQPENEALTPQELREALLAELEASQQVIAEFSDEQLEEIAGGRGGMHSGGAFIPGTGMRSSGGSGSMLKQAAIWTVGGTLATYGISMIGGLFGGGQSSSSSQG